VTKSKAGASGLGALGGGGGLSTLKGLGKPKEKGGVLGGGMKGSLMKL